MADKSVVVRLRAVVDQYKQAMEQASQATLGVVKSSGGVAELGPKMSKLGGTLTRNVTLPLLATGAAAGKLSLDFEATFARMEGLAGVAAGEVDGLKESVLGLAGDTARAPQDLAEGLYFIRSAGLAGKTALDALEVSAKGATAGLGSTAAVADAVTSAINAYGEANITAAEAGDILAATAREGKAEAAALAPQFGRLLPIAAELGVTFDEVGAGMAFLSRSSGDAALSATQLGGVLNKILEPGEEGADALNAIGSSSDKLRESIRERGLLATLTELRSSLEANGMSLNDFSRDQQFLQGALQLTGSGAAAAAQVFDALEHSTGTLGRAFDAVAKTDGFQMKQAMAEVQVALIQLGDILLPLVAKVAAFGAAGVAVFTAMPEPVQMLAVAFGAVLLAVGPVLSIAGKLAKNWGTLVKVFDKVALAAYDAAGSLAASAATAGAVTVAIVAVTAAVNQFGKAQRDAKRDGEDWAFGFAGQFDPSKATMAELNAEINRLTGASDEMQHAANNALNPFLDKRLKTARDELDATALPLIDLATKAGELQVSLGVTADEALDLASDTEFMGKATATATGELDDEAAAAALVTKEFSDLADHLTAMFSPLFGARDAMQKLKDAQQAVTDAVALNSDGIKDNNVSQEEMIRLNQEAVSAALDYEVSLINLKAAVEGGSVSVADSIATLQGWVEEGLITQKQADEAAWSISVMGGEADELDGKEIIVHAEVNVDEFGRQIEMIKTAIGSVPKFLPVGFVGPTLPGQQRTPGPVPRAAGGPVFPGVLYRVGESGEELMEFDLPGRIFSHDRSKQMVAAMLPGAGVKLHQGSSGGGGGMTVVNHYEINASGIDAHALGRTVRDAIEAGARRGIAA